MKRVIALAILIWAIIIGAFNARAEELTEQDYTEVCGMCLAEFGRVEDTGLSIIYNRHEYFATEWPTMHEYLFSGDFAKWSRRVAGNALVGSFRANGETWTITADDVELAKAVYTERTTDANEWDCKSDVLYVDEHNRVHNRYGSRYSYYGRYPKGSNGNYYGKIS